MEFAGSMHKGVYEMVQGWLEAPIKSEQVFVASNKPSFTMLQGSTSVTIDVLPVRDANEAIIAMQCVVAQVERIDERLLVFLLQLNLQVNLCAFGMDFEGKKVIGRCNLLGSTCDPNEFSAALGELVSVSDNLDDQIVQSNGGLTQRDLYRAQLKASGQGNQP